MASAVLTISDSENDGCVNISFQFDPQLDEDSPAHHIMAEVINKLKLIIGDLSKENLACALNQSS
jgi:hypothetical protein